MLDAAQHGAARRRFSALVALDVCTVAVALAESMIADAPDRELAHALLERVQEINVRRGRLASTDGEDDDEGRR